MVANPTSSRRPRDAVPRHRVASSEYPLVSFAQGNRYRIREMREGGQHERIKGLIQGPGAGKFGVMRSRGEPLFKYRFSGSIA